MVDGDIHVGDRFRIGTALLEVTQPRVPCYKLAMKMGVEGFYNRILESGRPGSTFACRKKVGLAPENIPFGSDPRPARRKLWTA